MVAHYLFRSVVSSYNRALAITTIIQGQKGAEMDRLASVIILPIFGGLFVLVVGGALGTIFSVAGNHATIGIGLAIVVLAPIVGAMMIKR